jgi:hypothetical protein
MPFNVSNHNSGRILITILITILVLFSLNNCTVKRAPVQPGTIPSLAMPNPGDEEFGKKLFKELCEDYKLDSGNPKQDKLLEIFNHITKAADVDHLDRKYSEEHEREAAAIALLIISRTKYAPQALLNFWKRVAQSDTLQRKTKRLKRDLSPLKRVALLEALVLELQDSGKRVAEHREK